MQSLEIDNNKVIMQLSVGLLPFNHLTSNLVKQWQVFFFFFFLANALLLAITETLWLHPEAFGKNIGYQCIKYETLTVVSLCAFYSNSFRLCVCPPALACSTDLQPQAQQNKPGNVRALCSLVVLKLFFHRSLFYNAQPLFSFHSPSVRSIPPSLPSVLTYFFTDLFIQTPVHTN